MIVAHTSKVKPIFEWQSLYDHSKGTAIRCSDYAGKFGFPLTGALIGWLHDPGKASAAFQKYIICSTLSSSGISSKSFDFDPTKVIDHSTYGGKIIKKILDDHKFDESSSIMISQIIMGHHAGLLNYDDCSPSSLLERMKKDIPEINKEDISNIVGEAEMLIEGSRLEFMSFSKKLKSEKPEKIFFAEQLLARMLFSCLCDADSLDTEFYDNPKKSETRTGSDSVDFLLNKLEGKLKSLRDAAKKTDINVIRDYVNKCCRDASIVNSNNFLIAADTGLGKTFAAFTLGLLLCKNFGKVGVNYYAPVDRILVQTADIFRDVFGDNNILEHHSNVVFSSEKSILAAENWDLPIILSSFVRFFDGFFASRKSECRRLHNVCNRVVIIDEDQSLPESRQDQIDMLLNELRRAYGVIIVKMSATPRPSKEKTYQIIPDPEAIRRKLKRYIAKNLGAISMETLINRVHSEFITKETPTACIFNYTSNAKEAYEKYVKEYGEDGVYCLCGTSKMIPYDQRKIIDEILRRLNSGIKTLLFSTQVIEAGLDISFLSIFRENIGIDSFKQTGGRVNRSKEWDMGFLYKFSLIGKKNPLFHLNCSASKEIYENHWDNIFDCKNVDLYFERKSRMSASKGSKFQFDKDNLLANKICGRKAFNFREISDLFSVIDMPTAAILIPCERTNVILDEARKLGKLTRKHTRELQQYCVNVHCSTETNPEKKILEKLFECHIIRLNDLGIWELIEKTAYNSKTGLDVESYK